MTDEVNKLIVGPGIVQTSLFQPTPNFRFLNKTVQARFSATTDTQAAVKMPVLQQLWADVYSPDKEWRDVPTEEE